MTIRLLFIACLGALLWFPGHSVAQTPNQVVPGSQSTVGCPGSISPCWTPYSATNPMPVSTSGGGSTVLTQVASTAYESSHVLKASGGTLYSVYASTQSTAGLLMIFYGVTSAPADGAVTPAHCIPMQSGNTPYGFSFGGMPADQFSTGAVAVFSTGTNCFSKVASASAIFVARVQ